MVLKYSHLQAEQAHITTFLGLILCSHGLFHSIIKFGPNTFSIVMMHLQSYGTYLKKIADIHWRKLKKFGEFIRPKACKEAVSQVRHTWKLLCQFAKLFGIIFSRTFLTEQAKTSISTLETNQNIISWIFGYEEKLFSIRLTEKAVRYLTLCPYIYWFHQPLPFTAVTVLRMRYSHST